MKGGREGREGSEGERRKKEGCVFTYISYDCSGDVVWRKRGKGFAYHEEGGRSHAACSFLSVYTCESHHTQECMNV